MLIAAVGATACRGESLQDRRSRSVVPFHEVFALTDSVELRTEGQDPVGRSASVVRWGDAIVIADSYQHNVKVFDVTGELRRTIGRVGDGPGEFRSPVSLGLLPDGLLAVVDDGRATLSVFDSAGALHRTLRLPGIGHGRMSMYPEGGRFVMPLNLRSDSSAMLDGVYILDTAGVITDTVARAERPTRPGQASINYLSAAVVGRAVAWIPMRDNTVHARHPDGRRMGPMRVGEAVYRPVEWPDRPLGPSDEGLQWMRSQMWAAGISALDSVHVLIRLSTGGEGRIGLNEHYYIVRRIDAPYEVAVGPTPVLVDSCEKWVCTSVVLDDDGGAHALTFHVVLPEPRTRSS